MRSLIKMLVALSGILFGKEGKKVNASVFLVRLIKCSVRPNRHLAHGQ
jgi:hypothetical protein